MGNADWRAPKGDGGGLTRVRAFVGLGANVGDAPATLAAAVHALGALPGASLVGVSRLYATRPVGVAAQRDFHNAVVALDVPVGPDVETGAIALLVALKGIERAFGRQARGRWGPRELDLDLLLFGGASLSVRRTPQGGSVDPGHRDRLLVVPHPEAADRLFVLAPLADLAPDLVPPGWTGSVRAARERRLGAEGPGAVRVIGRWGGETWVAGPGRRIRRASDGSGVGP
ncbi:MAG TPA: 2-amino-4-hydroxy-6-hydroxymethyldihydropteridine diphosphokinase [Candidatus Acidoferrales bacterium]|nr:2-amino-4-hydroxy-6-hydroxymethyldihydropteridine diphosphokinase [Candidatus Acidoferrales bacterium]